MPTLTSVYRDVRALSPRQRGQLVSRIVAEEFPSAPSEEEVDQRIKDVRSGKVKGIPVMEVIRQAHELAGLPSPSLKSARKSVRS